jgi:Spy/CpxP family protein refolding chaperone
MDTGMASLARARCVGTIIAVVCMLTVGGARADGPGDGPFGHGPGPSGRGPDPARLLLEHADWLSAETVARVRAVIEESRPAADELREQVRGERRALHELLMQDSPDRNLVLQQAERVGGLETELQKHRLSTLLTVHALLTPEERAELRSRMEKRHERYLARLRAACGEDIAQHCADAKPGRDTIRCLGTQTPTELTQTCRDQLAGPRGPGRRPHGAFFAPPSPAPEPE